MKSRSRIFQSTLPRGEPQNKTLQTVVAPLAGAWIEICDFDFNFHGLVVAPLAGAWIEMTLS